MTPQPCHPPTEPDLAEPPSRPHIHPMLDLRAHFARFLTADPARLHVAAHSHHPWPDVTRAAQIEARNISETVTAIDAALKKPGKTIAIVNLGPLLRKGGVLEKLSSMGVAIQAPAES